MLVFFVFVKLQYILIYRDPEEGTETDSVLSITQNLFD